MRRTIMIALALALAALIPALACETAQTEPISPPPTSTAAASAATQEVRKEPTLAPTTQPTAQPTQATPTDTPPPPTATPTLPPLPTATKLPAGEPASPPPPLPSEDPTVTPRDPEAFLRSLHPEERACLGAEVKTAADITEDAAANCLSEKNQLRLYMMQDQGPDALAASTLLCIEDALDQASDFEETQETPEDTMALMGKMMVIMVAIPLYCVATEQPELLQRADPQEQEDTRYLLCVIDESGGPGPWIQAILNGNDDTFGVAPSAVEEKCGPAPDQW